MLKIRRPLGRLIFNMGIAIPGKTVFLIETAPWSSCHLLCRTNWLIDSSPLWFLLVLLKPNYTTLNLVISNSYMRILVIQNNQNVFIFFFYQMTDYISSTPGINGPLLQSCQVTLDIFREPHRLLMGLPEISRVTLAGILLISIKFKQLVNFDKVPFNRDRQKELMIHLNNGGL